MNSTNKNVIGMIFGNHSELALIRKLMYLSRVKLRVNLRVKAKTKKDYNQGKKDRN